MKGRRRERRETYFEIRNVVNADDDHHPSSASSAVLYILPFYLSVLIFLNRAEEAHGTIPMISSRLTDC